MSLTVYLDLETRSTVDLRKTGVHLYAQDPTTDVIMACYAIGMGPVKTWFAGQPLPWDLAAAIEDGARIVAHNANFERALHRKVLVKRYGWPEIRLSKWDCTMARARACGLPGSLDGASKALSLRVEKDRQGHSLMLRMCRPRKIEEDGTIVWWEDEERMARLEAYCRKDVIVERILDLYLPQLPQNERAVWMADARLNDRGVPLDRPFLDDAIVLSKEATKIFDAAMKSVTGGAVKKATNVSALRSWLQDWDVRIQEDPEDDDEDEDDLPELRRRDVERLLRGELPDPCRTALEIRLEAGKSSVKKIDAMLRRVQADGRVRGMLTYWGAQTGRWSAAGSGIQLQNLPRDGVKDWDFARSVLDLGFGAVQLLEGSPLDVLSRMLRGAIYAPDGHDMIFADLSSVEARGVAWLAGQDDLVHAFATGAKIYERMAGQVFDVPETSIAKDSFERFVGKGLVLGSGYQMGAPKFAMTCAMQGRPVADDLAERAIRTYREMFPEIPSLWYGMERAAIAAVRAPGTIQDAAHGRIHFEVRGKWLVMSLPSGRELRYFNPRVELDERFSKDGLVYDGVDNKTKRWGPQRTYGGRLTENAVQAICRDIIAEAMLRLEDAGYPPILTVHDEIISLVPADFGSADEMVSIMCQVPAWAPGFPIAAEGKRARRYSK